MLVDVITREREGDLVDRIMIKKTCQMLVDLGIDDRSVYESIFERPFLKQSEIFYQACPNIMHNFKINMVFLIISTFLLVGKPKIDCA